MHFLSPFYVLFVFSYVHNTYVCVEMCKTHRNSVPLLANFVCTKWCPKTSIKDTVRFLHITALSEGLCNSQYHRITKRCSTQLHGKHHSTNCTLAKISCWQGGGEWSVQSCNLYFSVSQAKAIFTTKFFSHFMFTQHNRHKLTFLPCWDFMMQVLLPHSESTIITQMKGFRAYLNW